MNRKLLHGINITKKFGDKCVVNDIEFWVKENQFLTILGPSGCGKTTTLRMIAGFEQPTDGKILCDGKDITKVPAYNRPINTVFQKYALFPHMNIYENIAFGLRIQKKSESDIKKRVSRMLELVALSGFEKRNVNSLSGGQQQRVAIARALVNEPKILLLDEPLGALDLKLRKEMQLELKNMQVELGITFVYVTHDQEEALTMSDKIIVMNQGEIQQVGHPIDIYNEPQNAWVADFIGESNIFHGIMASDYNVYLDKEHFLCVDTGFDRNEQVDVVIRPEDVLLGSPGFGKVKGIVESIVFKGVHYEMLIRENDRLWMAHNTDPYEAGSIVGIDVEPDDIHIMRKEIINA